jgi:hypothetical protein
MSLLRSRSGSRANRINVQRINSRFTVQVQYAEAASSAPRVLN